MWVTVVVGYYNWCVYPDVSVSLPKINIVKVFESVNQEFSDALLVSRCDLKDDQDGCHLYFLAVLLETFAVNTQNTCSGHIMPQHCVLKGPLSMWLWGVGPLYG